MIKNLLLQIRDKVQLTGVCKTEYLVEEANPWDAAEAARLFDTMAMQEGFSGFGHVCVVCGRASATRFIDKCIGTLQ